MWKFTKLQTIVAAGLVAVIAASGASARNFMIPAGDLKSALDDYRAQTGVALVVSAEAIRGVHTSGANGDFSADAALSHILNGTGFTVHHDASGMIAVVRGARADDVLPGRMDIAATSAPSVSGASLETVTVTSSKIGGDVQNIPISITALSQEQLTATQTAGGPDLIKQVPNMTFTKTNFSGYSIQIRGIGTQAISVTTDPAVAVAFNDIPFIRNHFFEQEFYDVSQVEVLRGPQGTLYGRNATAGVVNLVSAKPTDQFEAMASGELGNYQSRRLEGMINIPVVDDRFDLRVAGEWTKRQGYSFNETTDQRIDGRDLWSSRISLGVKPVQNVQAYLVWEHFSEDDDRIRSAKQLCKTDYGPGFVAAPNNLGSPGYDRIDGAPFSIGPGVLVGVTGNYLTQGCKPASFYSADAYEAPLGYTLPYVSACQQLCPVVRENPYAETEQSRNLRVIQSQLAPIYKAKNDVVEFNADYTIDPALTLTSQTGYSQDFLYSAEDYNRFGSTPGFFEPAPFGLVNPDPSGLHVCTDNSFQGLCNTLLPGTPCTENNGSCTPAGVFCDPQLGCSNHLLGEDLSEEHAWQFSQEFRLASNFSGPVNFSAGGNYLHYETREDYYVFINTLTLLIANATAAHPWIPGVSDNSFVLNEPGGGGFQYNDPSQQAFLGGYIDPNPISHLNGNGHNYFRSNNPYVLNSYAGFGEANYTPFSDLKFIAGLRWTEDRKHFLDVPSWLVASGWGYPIAGVVDQQWDELTGRAVANWTPKLDFTDQTLIYGSYAHGYKAGGANPPGAILLAVGMEATHPATFKPEFIDAFELGTKNTLLDGALTLNGDVFYYNYQNYQISEIVDRTSVNLNFDAHAEGAEVEATYEPLPGLRFNFAGGWEDTAIAKGQTAVDLMDRTAGQANWYVHKPFVTESSNCIFPDYVLLLTQGGFGASPYLSSDARSYCSFAYTDHVDPITLLPYVPNPIYACDGAPTNGGACSPSAIKLIADDPNLSSLIGYPGFDPISNDPNAPANVNNGLGLVPNNGTGFSKNLGGNKLPNAPPFTVSFGAQYSIPITQDWAATLRGDYYWQADSFWRVFDDLSYDKLRGYSNVNLTLILTSQTGWQVMLYDKNVFNTTAITGAFLNSDDSGLTTNVFLTDPKLIGVRVTKNW